MGLVLLANGESEQDTVQCLPSEPVGLDKRVQRFTSHPVLLNPDQIRVEREHLAGGRVPLSQQPRTRDQRLVISRYHFG